MMCHSLLIKLMYNLSSFASAKLAGFFFSQQINLQ